MSQLIVHQLTKSFHAKKVINQLTFSVEKGEFVSILGPSGSGKSTLFHLIGGILTPDSGTIQLEGHDITNERGHISYMPQHPSLFPWRTVLQNVVLGQELLGKKEIGKAKEMLARAGLADYEHAFPHELSGGMKQRVAFVRALMSPQPIICLDEPFSALDELTRLEMQKWLLSICGQLRPTVIFVTHSIEEALFLSDRILVLSKKPAQIIAEFAIPFARPRKETLLLDEQFLTWKRKIYYTLMGESTS